MENPNCDGCGFICLSNIICSVVDCDKISNFFRSGRTSGNDNHLLTEHSSNQCSDTMCFASTNRRNHPRDVPYIDSRTSLDFEGKCQTNGYNDVNRNFRAEDSSTSSNPGNDLAHTNHQSSRQHRNSTYNHCNKDFKNVLRFLILFDLTTKFKISHIYLKKGV